MSYDPYARSSDTWDYQAQMALWRERAIHQAQRAEHFKALAEALRNGATPRKDQRKKHEPRQRVL